MKAQTVGERLAQYVGDAPDKAMTIRAFAKAMQDRRPKPRGSTRGMIHRYLRSASTPRAGFLDAAADVLGLNVEWLRAGEGEPTRALAAVDAMLTSARSSARADGLRIKAAVLGERAVPTEQANRATVPYWTAPLHDLLVTRDLVPYRGSDEGQRADLGRAIRAPLEALGIDAEQMGPRAFGDYVMAMVPVLFGLAAYQDRRRTEARGRSNSERFTDWSERTLVITRRKATKKTTQTARRK